MLAEEGRKTRILLVDGHRLVRQGIRHIFETAPDMEVVGEADNGEQAVRLVQELMPDVILMETRMGKVDSVEVTRRVKAHHPAAIVVVLTAYDDDEYIADMLRAGAGGCLLKNADGDQLLQAIRFIRAGVFVCDPAVEQRILTQAARPRPVAVDYGQHLTRRELEVLRLAAKGMNTRDIAAELGIGVRTSKHHLLALYAKLGVHSRTDAVLKAVQRGWVTLEDE